MKVLENIAAFKAKKQREGSMKSVELDVLCYCLTKIIKDLTPLRKDNNATRAYYERNLCHDSNMFRFYQRIAEDKLNGIVHENEEYQPGDNECEISEDTLHPALIEILADDRYSFAHLYWLLCSRYNRQCGFAFYNDIVIQDKTIHYAVDFDVEELLDIYKSELDILDTLDALRFNLADSIAYDGDLEDAVFKKLKTRYEGVANRLISELEHKLEKIDYPVRKNEGQVKEIPVIVDSVGIIEEGDVDYITYFDFTNCPVDVSLYPFSVHLSSYKVTRTTRGLEDESPILKDIFSNVYRQIAFADHLAAEDIFKDTRELLDSLFKLYTSRAVKISGRDFESILTKLKWWSQQVISCLSAAFTNDVLPESHYGVNEELRANAWKHCILYKESMSEYALLLPIVFLAGVKGNPYHDVHNVIPFNYYGEDYASVTSSAKKKTFRNESDRIATSYVENCLHLKKYLGEKLSVLDGQGINDRTAINNRHALIEQMVSMANDYINNLRAEGVTKSSHIKYAFDLWFWFVNWTNYTILHSQFGQNSCDCAMDTFSSEEDAQAHLNTGKQYADYVIMYNRESVKLQKTVMSMAASEQQERDNKPNTVDETKSSTKKTNAREAKSLSSFVVNSENSDYVMSFLRNHIGEKKNDQAFIFIEAAIIAGAIARPPFNSVIAEFPNIGKKNNYNNQVGKSKPNWFTDITVYVNEIKKNLK